jgi:16S rRNA (cytidine1402-2'-O)-methyltransferase
MKGKLYLIPSFLGSDNADEVFPELNKKIVRTISHFIVEEERTTRRFLKKLLPEILINDLQFKILNEQTKEEEIGDYLIPCNENSIGLISEAGIPCVADPGSQIVKIAHERNIEVVPLVGPCSIIMTLMASGLNGQNFAFNGYLPVKRNDRIKMIKFYEKRSFNENQTQLFIEAPYRNTQLLEDILNNCETDTFLCIACDLTLPEQLIKTKKIKEWKTKIPDIQKRPAIFAFQKYKIV